MGKSGGSEPGKRYALSAYLSLAELKALDDWRRAQPIIPSRAEACREALRLLTERGDSRVI